jgi:hypothetical protein
MTDSAQQRENLLRLAQDACDRGMYDLATIYQTAALKISLRRVHDAVRQLRRE